MSSVPGVSSYDKIFAHLAECPEFKDARAEWNRRLAAVRFDRYEFSYSWNSAQQANEVSTSFYATCGHKAYIVKENGTDRITYTVNDEFLLTDAEAERIVTLNFNTKRCKTYFCKLEKVVKGDDRKNHRREGFAAWARAKLKKETETQIVEAQFGVVRQVEVAWQSEQFLKDKQRFYERQVIEQIKAVVLKFYDTVDAAVLKEALDECVAHAVMES